MLLLLEWKLKYLINTRKQIWVNTLVSEQKVILILQLSLDVYFHVHGLDKNVLDVGKNFVTQGHSSVLLKNMFIKLKKKKKPCASLVCTHDWQHVKRFSYQDP